LLVDALPLPPPPFQVKQYEGVYRLANGAALYAWDTSGDGEVVVFIHPHSGNHRSWSRQQPVFAKAGYRVIGYSRRGYFGSEIGPVNDHGTEAGDLALLLDSLGIQRVHVVGSAAGGSCALDFTLAFPERTISSVVASSLMSIEEDDYKIASERARPSWFNELPVEAREISASFRALDPDGVKEFLEIYHLNNFGPKKQRVVQGRIAQINWKNLASNQVPMLLMTGGADLYLPPALLRHIIPRIGSAESVIVPDVGHPLFWESPNIFNSTLLEFFARSSGK
jgi:pimeloyl-ACP methyl ester carboxylesterase